MHENNHTGSGLLMCCTPGITQKRLSALPLADESEASIGPDHINPWRSEEERRIVEEIKRKRRERQDDQLFKTARADGTDTGGVDHPMHRDKRIGENPFLDEDPVDDPAFGWQTVEDDVFDLPALDEDDPFGVSVISPFSDKGPEW